MSVPRPSVQPQGATTGHVQLQVGAQSSYLPVVRAVAAHLAMIEDYNLDDISDLKLAVDEVCSTLIPLAVPGAELACVFLVFTDRVSFEATVAAASQELPPQDSFGWRILTTLADEVDTQVQPSPSDEVNWQIGIRIVKLRQGARR